MRKTGMWARFAVGGTYKHLYMKCVLEQCLYGTQAWVNIYTFGRVHALLEMCLCRVHVPLC